MLGDKSARARVAFFDEFPVPTEKGPELVLFRKQLIGTVLVALAGFATLPLLLVVPTLLANGDFGYATLYLVAYLALLATAAAGERFPTEARAWTAILFGYGAAIAGLFRLGLAGNALLVMSAFVAIAALLVGIRGALVLLSIGVAALLVAAVGFEVGWLHVDPTAHAKQAGPTAWAVAVVVFVATTSVITLGPLILVRRLNRALQLEEERRGTLEHTILAHAIAERERARSEQRFEELAEMLPQTIWESTPDGRLTYVNRSAFAFSGYTLADLKAGLYVFDLLHAGEHARARHNWELSLRGEGPQLAQYKVRRKDGSLVPCLISSTPIVQGDQVVGLRGVLIDESERCRLEDRIRTGQKMEALGTLAGGVAHDFNNLLLGIQGHTSVLLAEEPPERARESLQSIETFVQAAARLTRQLLGLARPGRHEKSPTDLAKLVFDTVEVFKRTRKDVELELSLPSQPVVGELEADEMQQVVLNLLLNAGQAMPDGGRIMVQVERAHLDERDLQGSEAMPAEFARITIQDSGPGIEPEHLQRIFEPFFTTKERGEGTGLGLATAYRTVSAHGGLIRAESTVGSGAVFRVEIPLGTEVL